MKRKGEAQYAEQGFLRLDRAVEFDAGETTKHFEFRLGHVTKPIDLPIDLILTADNEPRIIEIGARIGATCLPELVEIHTGIQWVHETIRACLGEAVNLESKVDRATAALILESPGDGIFTGYTAPPGIDDDKEVVKWEVTVEPGEEVNVLRKGTDRIGKIVTVADTLKAAESKAIEMKRRFEFRIQ